MSPRRTASGSSSIIQYLQICVVICFYFVSVLLYEDYSKEGTISTFINRYSSVTTNADSAEVITTAHQINELQKNSNLNRRKKAKPRKLIHLAGDDIPGVHSKKTRFINSGISAEFDGKKNHLGIKANRDIAKYEILLVEEPLLLVPEYDLETSANEVLNRCKLYHDIIEKQSAIDPEFENIWKYAITKSSDIFNRYATAIAAQLPHGSSLNDVSGLDDVAKVHSNQFGILAAIEPSGVYSVLSKFKFVLPQNVAVFFGEKKDNFVCVVIATKDITKGEELGFDYYYDWNNPWSLNPERMLGRVEFGKQHGFHLDDKWKKITRDLTADDVSVEEKGRIFYSIYEDGIINKAPGKRLSMVKGCMEMSADHCKRRKEMRQFVDNGGLFDLVEGRSTHVPLWTGKEFAEAVKNGKFNRH